MSPDNTRKPQEKNFDINTRLKELMEEKGWTTYRIVKETTGINPATLSRVWNAKTMVSSLIIGKCLDLEPTISLRYIYTGEEPKWYDRQKEPHTPHSHMEGETITLLTGKTRYPLQDKNLTSTNYLHIPPNEMHSFEALENSTYYVIFSPGLD